ncbi:hypothetical protein [Streptomyces variabilis]
MHLADTYRESPGHRLVGYAKQGTLALPQALLDDHAALLALIEEGQRFRRWISPVKEAAAEKVARNLHTLRPYGKRDTLIRDYIRPALEDYLARFKQAYNTAGKHAQCDTVQPYMLLEPEPVRVALTELHDATQQYGSIRHAWALLRGGSLQDTRASIATTVDPHGANSILGEVRNIADIFPEWVNAGAVGGTPWPWQGRPAHLRLAWILANGGEIWAPTADEHNHLYQLLRAEGRADAGPMRQQATAVGIGF